jgi:hypothetical protein
MTQAAIDAWLEGDAWNLHRAIHLKPWAISPLIVHRIAEPPKSDQLPIYFQSWFESDTWRRALEDISGVSYAEVEFARE